MTAKILSNIPLDNHPSRHINPAIRNAQLLEITQEMNKDQGKFQKYVGRGNTVAWKDGSIMPRVATPELGSAPLSLTRRWSSAVPITDLPLYMLLEETNYTLRT